jgi:microcystin-dependent protein
MNKLLKNIQVIKKSFNKKYGKTTIKNILLVLSFLIVLILGIYLGRLLNKNKEGFEDSVTDGFFSSDAIMSVKNIELTKIIKNIETNTANIKTNTANIETNTANIETNTANIETNTANIETNTANIESNNNNIINKVSLRSGTIIPYFPVKKFGVNIDKSECIELLKKGFIPCDNNIFKAFNNKFILENDNNLNIGSIFKDENYIYLTNYSSSNIISIIDLNEYTFAKIPILNRKFIVGSGPSNNEKENYEIGTTGGEEKHILSVSELPSHNHIIDKSGAHNHTFNVGRSAWGNITGVGEGAPGNTRSTNYSGNHTHKVNNTGDNQPHENRPPYMAMIYIYYLGDGYKYYDEIPEKLSSDNIKKAEIIKSIAENALA